MAKEQSWTIVGIALVVAVVASIATASITGNAIVGSSNIKANSCDSDSICEVAKTISTNRGSTSNLILTSDTKGVIVDGVLSVNGGVFIDRKTISTTKGSTSALVLTSDVKGVIVDGSLSANSLAGTGNAYACVNSVGKLFRSVNPCK